MKTRGGREHPLSFFSSALLRLIIVVDVVCSRTPKQRRKTVNEILSITRQMREENKAERFHQKQDTIEGVERIE